MPLNLALDYDRRLTSAHNQAEASLRDTRDFMTFVRERCCGISRGASSAALGSALVQPIITPRFAIACSDELLAGLGEILSKDESLLCQTHLSENPSEIEFTKCELPLRARMGLPSALTACPMSSSVPLRRLLHGSLRSFQASEAQHCPGTLCSLDLARVGTHQRTTSGRLALPKVSRRAWRL